MNIIMVYTSSMSNLMGEWKLTNVSKSLIVILKYM